MNPPLYTKINRHSEQYVLEDTIDRMRYVMSMNI
jgi:hypothetical protein